MIAESYERIHRSNLVGMGIVPLQYLDGQTADSISLTGRESYDIIIPEDIKPGQIVTVQVCPSVYAYCCVVCNVRVCVCACACMCVSACVLAYVSVDSGTLGASCSCVTVLYLCVLYND